ncbi:HypC/HybG/HupF family hydrogenase formation chaperone [archaeon]|nr:HypC/HybG/HupF family hydrogenase formation chaperone [archaeon]
MCLAVPARIVRLNAPMAIADFGGVRKEVFVGFVPDVKEGDYVLVHAGLVIQKLSLEEARELIRLWKEVLEAESEQFLKE